jgi:hypothetical protein
MHPAYPQEYNHIVESKRAKLHTLVRKVSVGFCSTEILRRYTHNRLLCSLSAIGASGCMIVSQAFGTLTLMIAFLLTFFKTDFEPSVATNLQNPRKISNVRHIDLHMMKYHCVNEA